MHLAKDYYLSQLYTLKCTEENTKSLAMYIRTYRHDHRSIADGLTHARSRSSIHHRLNLYYLINEILVTEKSQSGVQLRSELKRFVRDNFTEDMAHSAEHETLSSKFSELRRFWETKGLVDFEDRYELDDVLGRIRECFYDKSSLLKYLEEMASHYRKEC